MGWFGMRAANQVEVDINDFINDPSGTIDKSIAEYCYSYREMLKLRKKMIGRHFFECKYCGRKYKEAQESCRGCGADVF